jgi:DnaK suppressor protein
MPHRDFVDSRSEGTKQLTEIDTQRVEGRLRERAHEIAARRAHLGEQNDEIFEQGLDETTDMILEEEERRVKEAQQRLAEGKYGKCIVCGEDIPEGRLEAIPETVRCIEHQREYDARA